MVMITREGLAAIGGDSGALSLRDGDVQSEARVGTAADPVAVDAAGMAPAYSPPLSSEEIAHLDILHRALKNCAACQSRSLCALLRAMQGPKGARCDMLRNCWPHAMRSFNAYFTKSTV